MMFFWKLVGADITEACRVVERLQKWAIALKWLPVGDVVHLSDQECSEGNRLPGREQRPDGGGQVRGEAGVSWLNKVKVKNQETSLQKVWLTPL